MIFLIVASLVITTSAGYLHYPNSRQADRYYPKYNYANYPSRTGVARESTVNNSPVCGIFNDDLQTFPNIYEFNGVARYGSGELSNSE